MWGTEHIWLIAFAGGLSFISNTLYMLGGTSGFSKALRRFVGAFLLALATNIVALVVGGWDWRYILMFPCLVLGFSLGYGADTTWLKVIKRTVFALGVLSACFVGLWITSFSVAGWLIFGLATLTGLTSVALGVFNPFKNAPLEQFLVSQVLTLYVPFWGLVNR